MKSIIVFVLPVVLMMAPAVADARADPHVIAALDRLEGLAPSVAGQSTCATTDILRVRAAWHDLDPADQDRLDAALGGVGDEERGGGMACFATLPNVAESDHFTVQWGDAGGTSESAANHLLVALESARTIYLAAGYAEPFGNPSIQVPFYLGNSGSGAPSIDFDGAYTTVCSSYQHAYGVLSSIEFNDDTANTGAHELFHAVQMGSPNPYSVDSFYWEASAVWAEELARPDLNIYAWSLPYYTGHTELALNYGGSGEVGLLHESAMFILPAYIEQHAPGGPQALVDVWNGASGDLEDRLEASWTAQGFDTSFEREFGAFTAFSSVMAYEDQPIYDSARIQPWRVLDSNDEVEGEVAPGHFGSHYYQLDLADDDVGAGRTRIRLSLDGRGPSWILALNRSSDGDAALPTVVLSDDDGLAVIEADDVGTLYSEAWIVVTCSRNSCAPYDLTVRMVEQTEQPDDDDDSAGDDDDSTGDDDDSATLWDDQYSDLDADGGSGGSNQSGGCSCSDAARTGTLRPLLLLTLVLLPGRRRRGRIAPAAVGR
jgi:hypothetical protein